jgi:hypothetical protein
MTTGRGWTALGAGLVGAVFLAGGGNAWAQQVPSSLQAAIIARVLGHDRALKERVGPSVSVGILFRSSDKGSLRSEQEMVVAFQGLESRTVQGLPLNVASHAYQQPAALAAWIAKEGIDVLYVAPGLGDGLEAIRGISAEKKVVTVSAVRSQVEQGLAIGIVLKGEAPRILVNAPVTSALGMSLDPKLLQLSEIIR